LGVGIEIPNRNGGGNKTGPVTAWGETPLGPGNGEKTGGGREAFFGLQGPTGFGGAMGPPVGGPENPVPLISGGATGRGGGGATFGRGAKNLGGAKGGGWNGGGRRGNQPRGRQIFSAGWGPGGLGGHASGRGRPARPINNFFRSGKNPGPQTGSKKNRGGRRSIPRRTGAAKKRGAPGQKAPGEPPRCTLVTTGGRRFPGRDRRRTAKGTRAAGRRVGGQIERKPHSLRGPGAAQTNRGLQAPMVGAKCPPFLGPAGGTGYSARQN